MKIILAPEIDPAEKPGRRYCAVLFRGTLYIATPRHKDALDLMVKGMSELSRRNVASRIAERKEPLIFGHAMLDGRYWEPVDNNEARLMMYGFEEPYP